MLTRLRTTALLFSRGSKLGVPALAFCVFIFALGISAEAQGRPLARIQTLSGLVEVLRAASQLTVTQNNFALLAEDRVRTGATGRARIVTLDGKRATLGPNSEIQIHARGARIGVGRAAFLITRQGRTEVGMPGGIAAAEGTAFLVEVGEGGVSTVTVAEGEVLFFNPQGRQLIAAGQQSTAAPGVAPSRPIVVGVDGVLLFEASVENLPLPLEAPAIGARPERLRELLADRERAVAAAPADAAAHEALGDVSYDLGDLGKAREAYVAASRLSPQDGRPLLRLVLVEAARGRPDLAKEVLGNLQAARPGSGEAYLAEGALHLAEGAPEKALPLLERAQQSATVAAQAGMLRGVSLMRLREFAAAETALAAVVKASPENAAAQAYLSSVLLARGSTTEAAAAAERAVAQAPQSALSRQALGAVRLFTGHPAEAITELRKALEIQPVSAAARLQLARALAALSDLRGAIREASVAVVTDPADPSAHVTLGTLLLADNDTHRAEREFNFALKLAPNLGPARTGLAAAALEKGAFGRALREQKAGLSLDEGSPQAWNNLGAVHLAEGRLSKAVEGFQRAIREQPEFALARANLALTYLELNRYAKALDEARKASKLGERSARLRTTVARIYMRQNRMEQALVELRAAESLDPLYPLHRFYLSQVYRQQGRERDALRTLFRGITLDPSAMVEQRQYSRGEGTVYGGENGHAGGDLKLDGRAEEGRLSYFLSGSKAAEQLREQGGDLDRGFAEGILGLESSPRNNLVLYGSYIRESVDAPGAELRSGLLQDPNFRRHFDGSDLQLMDRYGWGGRNWLTLKTGFRRAFLEANNPANPPGTPDPIFLRRFAAQDSRFFAEGLWERQLGKTDRDLLQVGLSYQRRRRAFEGEVPEVPGPGLLRLRSRESPEAFTGWTELRRQLNRRLDVTVGAQAGFRSRGEALARPKAVARYDAGGGNRFAALMYSQFQSDNGDLLPVEAWAQPFDLDRLLQADDSVLTNYELTWERSTPGGSLVGVTGFYRRGKNLSIPTVDPATAPTSIRLPISRGDILGGQVSLDHPLTDSLTGRLFGRFQDTKSAVGAGELPYLPRWLAGARLDYLDRRGIRAYLAANYIGRRTHTDFLGGPQRILGSYITADLRISWQENLHRAYFIQVNDLFDRGTDYYHGFRSAGRTVFGGIEFRF